jgi:hypothetical protein
MSFVLPDTKNSVTSIGDILHFPNFGAMLSEMKCLQFIQNGTLRDCAVKNATDNSSSKEYI